uniref:Glycoamylase-like domain-containing protein n=1 Tax=Solibacter usitatus (strain Ellin6076) TaxID=234267 RepID=Q027N6_SOLUE
MGLSRRHFLKTAAAAAGCPIVRGATAPDRASDHLLDELEHRACRYFYEMADPNTGLVRDRASASEPYAPSASSIAATGFGLSALAIGASRRFVDAAAAQARVRTTLKFFCERAEQEHGFFYHFVDSDTGKRIWKSELSSVDTAWLLCGVLHSNAFWDDPEIRKYARELLDRADWQWMLNGSGTLCHGWTPENGFLQYRWDAYTEVLAMYLLAIGSETHPIPASSWQSFVRPMHEYQGVFFIDAGAPLFVHQYSHAWFDFRGRQDRYADYFNNSVRATQAHRLFCLSYSRQFPWYTPDMWGVTASDSRDGYRIWCSPSSPPDGTLVPCAAGGSLVFLPQMCGSVLQNMFDQYGDKVWTKYGFVDAFHPKAGWFSRYVLGIDQGVMLLMAENLRSASVWSSVMSTPEARRALQATAFHPYPLA